MVEKQDSAPKVDRFWHTLYIEMQADPTDTRTDTQFCDDIKLDHSTFRNWKSNYRPYIFSEVERRRKNYKNELRSKIYKSLTKKLDKDTNAIKLLAQLLGDLVEKSEVRTENMSDADKARRVQSLLSEISTRKSRWASAKGEEAQQDSTAEPVEERTTADPGEQQP